MKAWFVTWATLSVALAGCLGPPEIPEDAATDTDEALPGLTLSAWTEEHAGRVQLHAVLTNDHDRGYWYLVNCGHPWNVTLTGPAGEPVQFRQVLERAGCAPQYEILQPKQHLDTLYSWDGHHHEPETGGSSTLPDGAYVWTVEVAMRDVEAVLSAAFAIGLDNGTVQATQ